MSSVVEKHGNALTLVILDSGLTFPTLTPWSGTAGNIIFLNCLADDGSENSAKANPKEYRTNDSAIYAQDISEITGETKARFYLQDMLTNTFMWKAVKDAIAAGKKVLEIYNMGYREAKWQETIKIGDVIPSRMAIAKNAAPNEYLFKATPQQANFTLSAQNITDIKAVSGYPSNHIHCAGPHTILANEPEIVVYT